MRVALSHPGSRHWLVPVLLAIIVPLLFAALPGEPLQTLARDASLVKHVHARIEALHRVRTGFQQARQAAADTRSQTGAMSGIKQALDAMTGEGEPADENVAVLRDAIAVYAQPLMPGRGEQRQGVPLPVGVPANSIEPVLGRLQAGDEARLQEPLLAMRLAAATLRFERDPRLAAQVSHWAEIFTARLDDMAIPSGTRANLKARLATYEQAVLTVPDTSPGLRADREGPQAARGVETALANAEHALIAEQRRLNKVFAVACNGFVWSFAAALAASLLIVGGGVFGRMVVDHGVAGAWHAR